MTTSGQYNFFPGQVLEGGVASYLAGNQLRDRTKYWGAGQWIGKAIRLRGGNNNGFTTVVVSNDATSITFADALPNTVETTLNSTYEILAGPSGSGGLLAGSDQANNLADEILVVLKQIRYGIGLLTETDLTDIDPE